MNKKENDDKVVVKLKKEYLASERRDNKYKSIIKILTVFLCISFCFIVLLSFKLTEYDDENKEIGSYSDKANILKKFYSDDWLYGNEHANLDNEINEKMFYGMSRFDEDPYSTYMSADEMNSFSSSINQVQLGIGVSYYSEYNGYPLVREVYKDSGAYDAGIQKGDYIYSIDGESAYNVTDEHMKELALGDAHTFVNVVVDRNGEKISFDCERKEFDSTVRCKTIGDVVYLQLTSFGENTAKTTANVLKGLESYHKLIIDVRNNSGGYQDSLLEVAGIFLPDDTEVMKEIDKNGDVETFACKFNTKYLNFDKIFILINENTASAAEVFSICMKEQHNNTTLVGKKTYGKGVVQSNFPLSDGSYLKLTTSYWTSPYGVSLKNEGIKPDIELDLKDIFYMTYYELEEGTYFELDSVSNYVEIIQNMLDYLGYPVYRLDGYFDESTDTAIKQFKLNNNLDENGILDKLTYEKIIDAFSTSDRDDQLDKTLELINR